MSESDSRLSNIEGGINKKLSALDAGIEKLSIDSLRKEEKQDIVNNKMEARLNKMEEDMRRLKHRRMTSDTLRSKTPVNQASGRISGGSSYGQSPVRRDNNLRSSTPMGAAGGNNENFSNDEADAHQEEVDGRREEDDGRQLVRQMSWAEEVEENLNAEETSDKDDLENRRREEDRLRWSRKGKTGWAENLDANLKMDGEKKHPKRKDNENKNEKGRARRLEEEKRTRRHVKCDKDKIDVVKHWFGDCDDDSSSSEDDDEEESADISEENWNKIDRIKKNKQRRRRSKEKKRIKRTEVLDKAQRMIGIGPITDSDIEDAFENDSEDYEAAKTRAAKIHLAKSYEYTDREL